MTRPPVFRSLAVFRIGNIGDMLVALPALRALQCAHPAVPLVLLSQGSDGNGMVSAAETARMLGAFEGTLEYRSDRLRPALAAQWGRLVLGLRRSRVDGVVYLPPPQRTSRQISRDRFFFCLAGVPVLAGPRKPLPAQPREANGLLTRLQRESERLLDMVRAAGLAPAESGEGDAGHDALIPLHAEAAEAVDRWLHQAALLGSERLVAFCPGSNMPAKCWPAARFRTLGRRLIAESGVVPVVVGGPGDRELGAELVRAWPTGANAAGEFSVAESIECVRRCSLFIGNDTGVMHMAASVGTPCLALFSGRDNPGRWEPWGAGHVVVRKHTPCEGCMAKDCPEPGHPCMTTITVDEVAAQAKGMLR